MSQNTTLRVWLPRRQSSRKKKTQKKKKRKTLKKRSNKKLILTRQAKSPMLQSKTLKAPLARRPIKMIRNDLSI